MIVVVTTHRGLFRRWAGQFVDKDRAGRDVVAFPHVRNGARGRAQARQRLATVYGEAARRAGARGTVIISVGHGGSRANEGGGLAAGMIDLAPNSALRVDRANVFYNNQQTDTTVVATANRAGRARCRALLRRYDLDESPRRPEPPPADSNDYISCYGADSARARLAIRQGYDAIGGALRRHRVANVVFLSCNVGNATRFVDRIGQDWGVQITAYTRRVGVIEDNGGQARVYLYGDRPGSGTNTDRGRSEVPDASQYVSGGY